MTALIVIGIILLIIFLLLLVRVCVKVQYKEKFLLSVSVFGIEAFSTDAPKKEKKPSADKAEKKPTEQKPKKDNIIKVIYDKKGLSYTVKLITDVIGKALKKLLWLLKRLKIRKFNMSLSVVGSDAADTAIKYGGVCAAVYPLIGFIDSNLNFKAEKIDVYADFDGKENKFNISAEIKSEILILLILAVKLAFEYLKLYRQVTEELSQESKNENKKHKTKDVF